MTKYVATRKLSRRMPLAGFVRETLDNGQIISITKEVMAGPGDIFETEVDLDSWVCDGYLVVRDDAKVAVEPDTDPDDEGDLQEVGVEEVFEIHEDGSYECLLCGKIYEESSRAAYYMERHLYNKHGFVVPIRG